MKTSKLTIVLAALILMNIWTKAKGEFYLFGLSPNYSKEDQEAVFKSVALFLLDGMSVNDRAVIYDALNLKPITTFSLPNERIYEKNPRARAQHLKGELATLKEFLAAARIYPSELARVVNVPEFLAFSSSQLRNSQENMRIILIASPFFVSPTEPSFNMTDGLVPSDGSIMAGCDKSVFGTADRKTALNGMSVHYAYVQDNFASDLHRDEVRRFWANFMGEQGGVLGTFAPSISLAIERALQTSQQACVSAQIDASDSKVEMRRIGSRTIPLWFPPTNSINITVTNPISYVVTDTSANAVVGIGIMWTANGCDFDLWVKPSENTRELYYGNNTTSEGKYFRDFRNRNDQRDYEYVELKQSVDLRQARVWVNFYSGKTPSPAGIVIVHYRGKTYQSAFFLKASKGNHGKDSHLRSQSSYWTEINISQIVGLSP